MTCDMEVPLRFKALQSSVMNFVLIRSLQSAWVWCLPYQSRTWSLMGTSHWHCHSFVESFAVVANWMYEPLGNFDFGSYFSPKWHNLILIIVIPDSWMVSRMFGTFHRNPGGPKRITNTPRRTALWTQCWIRCQCWIFRYKQHSWTRRLQEFWYWAKEWAKISYKDEFT